MLLKLALVVLFASIAVLFSQDFVKWFKKILAIKGMKLFLPLIIASLVFYSFDYWLLWIIFYYREVLHSCSGGLSHILPFHQYSGSIALILILTFVSVVPVYLIDLYVTHKTFKHFKYPYVTSTLIFLVSVISLLALYNPG